MEEERPVEFSTSTKAVFFVVGGATQMSFFLTFFSVDYVTFFFGKFHPEFYLALFVSFFSFVGAILTFIRPFETFYQIPMVGCYLISMTSSISIPVFVFLVAQSVLSDLVGFILVVGAFSVLGFFESINSGCVFSFLAKTFSSKGVQLAQSGTTWVAFSVYVVRVILKAATPNTQFGFVLSGFIQFGTVSLWMLVCAVLSFWLTSTHKIQKQQEDEPLLVNESSQKSNNDYSTIFNRCWMYVLSMVLGLVFNQMFYPGVFSIIHGVTYEWFVVILFGFFAVGDTIGQTLPGKFPIYQKGWFWAFPVSQFVLTPLILVPLFLSDDTPVLSSDAYAWILALVWGFNVGSGVCCSMMLIVQEAGEELKGLASTTAIVTLQFGLVVAAACAFGILSALDDDDSVG